jgi:GH15 family glucan-1,4-alpha-glucosidase
MAVNKTEAVGPRRPIEDYGLIGNLHTVALIARDGSLEWFCPGRFDAPACFAALLGDARHGYWYLGPRAGQPIRIEREYLTDTLLLKTTFHTPGGVVEVLDFMPVRWDCHLIRQVRCLEGTVAMTMTCSPRFEYGRDAAKVEFEKPKDEADKHLATLRGADLWLRLASTAELALAEDAVASEFTLAAGESHTFVLTHGAPQEAFAPVPDADSAREQCMNWWREWVSQCTYQGPWEEAVRRSLITLKALIYVPSGALVAAATTSLPEVPGGSANWDYRYTWPRDAALVFDVLLRSGFEREEEAWRDWLLRAVENSQCQLRTLYTVDGEVREEKEREIDWLPGYGGARPVRVGNAAADQYQLDLRGEVIDMLHLVRKEGQAVGPELWDLQCHLLERLEEEWQEPDTGIWESRDEPRHYTHSKVFAWAAFARSVHDAEAYDLDAPVEKWRRLRDQIKDEVLARAVHTRDNYFVRFYGDDQVDAALLMMPLLGFLPPDDPRVVATVREIERHHCSPEGFVYRNPLTDFAGEEGAFLLCTYWLADYYMIAGDETKAKKLFETLLGIRNDLGLLAEEYDPVNQHLLGNFPQSFSHLSLIKSALFIGGHQKVEFSGGDD